MPRTAKIAAEVAGEGAIRFEGYDGPVRFFTRGDPKVLRQGPAVLRGALLLEPALAEAAFRSGEARLTTSSGECYRLTFLGHTAGDDRTYFEMRV
jgi:hypothetical protein